ncbi:18.1 kDa class I heat shock protein (Fragment) [Linum perenne]
MLLDPFLSMVNRCPVLSTPTDWKETPEAHVFTSDIPGLTNQDVKVELVDGGTVLQISGERPTQPASDDDIDNDKWHRVERCRGKFLRRFRLPENAIMSTSEVKASVEDGVLVVFVPKREIKKPVRKVIQIQDN